MVDLSIIIVNYNTEEHVQNCIDSIYQNLGILNYEIVIVDNVSNNFSFEAKMKQHTNVKYFNLNSNYGFGYACNRGVEKSSGNVLLFLNPDIIVTKGSIESLYSFLIKKDDAGFVTGLLTDQSFNLQYFYNYFPGLLWEFKEAFGVFVSKTINKLNDIPDIKNLTPFQIDWAHGACLMIKSKVFKLTSGFDERIFLYYEDVDIQKQIVNIKYKNYCQPNSQFIHFQRSSVRTVEGIKTYHFYMHYSKHYYMKKYFPLWKRLAVRMFYIIGYSSKILMLPFRAKYKNERALMFSVYNLVIAVHLNIKKQI